MSPIQVKPAAGSTSGIPAKEVAAMFKPRASQLLPVLALAAALVSCTESGIAMNKGGPAPGQVITVDNSGDAGQFVSMDIDVNDHVHLVYYDKKNQSLKYVQWSRQGLAADVIDDSCRRCLFATVKVSGKGEPHVAYYSDSTQTFTYAYRSDQGWKRESIEWGAGTGMGARLLVDDSYTLHALYYSGDGWLKHAWRVKKKPASARPAKGKHTKKKEEPEGLWGNERVDKANGSERVQISFVTAPDGRLAASYLHWSGLTSQLRLAERQADGTWKSQVVAREHNPGKSSALFYDEQGQPRIIFRQAMKNRLCLAEFSGQEWKVSPLVPDAYNMALAMDAGGNLLLAYEHLTGRDPRKGHLRYALRRVSQWTMYTVDTTPGTGTHLDAVFTSNSVPVIAFYEESGHSLKLYTGK